jgi:hypothetical protein
MDIPNELQAACSQAMAMPVCYGVTVYVESVDMTIEKPNTTFASLYLVNGEEWIPDKMEG